ncbi:TetR/AcrR family transcriptional regulator [Actinotalea sp. M2MS4P-6]|uniref:TetR/AcrR family transcriptional regulator n=1 Tax=Actinotalea sp. M2MS4P-6 TaxID=2983762 RepID=UPI0021E48D0F|nr:TetR/AcrR family transcriptional regulator [Actinotalea sp. M2MS4P-6]MCV2394269.1 TetR/AcrR family transcriptional regulator [Actinotalea sp. M2MS4P-6]
MPTTGTGSRPGDPPGRTPAGTAAATPAGRARLNRDIVLRAAVDLADTAGIDAVSMRSLAAGLGVVPMALYKHVANKDELLDGMVEAVVGEIEPARRDEDWKASLRRQVLSARRALLRHPWAPAVIESRPAPTPRVLDHLDSVLATLRSGGLSVPLAHHAMHALGSRVWGFTQEVFPSAPPPEDPAQRAQLVAAMAARWPNIVESAAGAGHDATSTVGAGCDDQAEFEFALDLLLDGIERRHREGWTPAS